MIKKERLEELIRKGATIYIYNRKYIGCCSLKNAFDCDDEILYLDDKDGGEIEYLTNLFETRTDAEEYAEFGNITRTERLELPSWASIEKDFDKFTNGSYVLVERDEFLLELKVLQYFPTQIVLLTDTEKYGWNLSRENYNEARRLCIKLFKGEK